MGEPSIEVFVDESDGVESIALVLRAASIVEYEGELVPACRMSIEVTRHLINALWECIERIQEPQID